MARLDPADRVRRAERLVDYIRAAVAQDCPCGHASWRVVKTSGRVRYAKCRNCGRHAKIVAG